MKRELAGMTWEELLKWEIDRRAEIKCAHARGDISIETHQSLQSWVSDNCRDWLAAWEQGLLGEGQ